MSKDDPLSGFESLEGEILNLEAQKTMVDENALRQLAQMRETIRDLKRDHKRLLERQADQKQFTNLIKTLNANNASLTEAIIKSTEAASAAFARLEIELVSRDGRRPTPALEAVLREGRYLADQLGVGRLGTESPDKGFERANVPNDRSGLEVFAATLVTPKASRKTR